MGHLCWTGINGISNTLYIIIFNFPTQEELKLLNMLEEISSFHWCPCWQKKVLHMSSSLYVESIFLS